MTQDQEIKKIPLEVGKTQIGSMMGKFKGEVYNFQIYYGNYILPSPHGEFIHYNQNLYKQTLMKFLDSEEGQKYIRPTEKEIEEATQLVISKESDEGWAQKLQNAPTVAEVYINGKELISIVRERENKIKDADDLCEPGSYGHLSVDELYRELHETQTGQYRYAHLLCCNNCGDCFCWSVQAKISVGLKYVTWTLSHNHRDWDYNLKYCFDKMEYMGLLRRLRRVVPGEVKS